MKRLLALALLVFAASVCADYPDRPIRFIVPQAAGSATDNVARLLAPEMAKQLAQQVVVENRPGGALTIGIDAIAPAESKVRNITCRPSSVSPGWRLPLSSSWPPGVNRRSNVTLERTPAWPLLPASTLSAMALSQIRAPPPDRLAS